ncbi:uncharacterized protein DUF4303 [Nocardiopsis sp. Huas11]|uniref:DUF4303 domain-containing protein n=1 Tax=Nocardiopsis sp. Huas11 TaxID=2183912 RepID=UPI000EAB77E3|nr:DUF4303 domain-containing protein [Nocardiopsis sp. Huas11]RKS04624.1 uncharacterized protein DUF4303 [Nocardiopsis sp. Huas11]
MEFDWQGLEEVLGRQVVGLVRRVREEHPRDRLYGAAVHEFYAEQGGMIGWTMVGVASEEWLAEAVAGDGACGAAELRWSPADWPWQHDPGRAEDEWARRLQAHATADGERHWDEVHDRYLRTVVAACRSARHRLVTEGVVDADFVVVAMDEDWELVPLSLTRAEVGRHFPDLVAEEDEVERLQALAPQRRARELVALTESPAPGPLSAEKATDALRALGGPEVLAAVLEHLPGAREKWRWAKLLAEIAPMATPGAPPAVIAALEPVMADGGLPEPDRAWAAAALALLGRMGLVAARLDRLPRGVALRGLTAPYTGFRDHGEHGGLDYAPLEEALADRPGWQEAVLRGLAPGGFCAIGPEEVETALAGLESALPAVRRHAVHVLADAPTTPDQRDRYTARLWRLRREDPHPAVREAAAFRAGR